MDELAGEMALHFLRPVAQHRRRTGTYPDQPAVAVGDVNEVLRRFDDAFGLAFRILACGDVDGHRKPCGFAAELDVAEEQVDVQDLAVLASMPPVDRLQIVDPGMLQPLHQPPDVLRRPDVLQGHGKEFFARIAIDREGGLVHLEEFQGLDAVDPHRQRRVLEQVAEILLAPGELGFAIARLGHVGIGHDAAARRQRVEGHRDDPSVRAPAFADEALARLDQAHPEGDGGLLVLGRVLAALGEVADDLLVRHAADIPVGIGLEPFGQAAIVGHDPELAVEQDDALFDVLQDRLQVGGLLGDFFLPAAQLGQVVPDPDIARERAVGGEQGRTAEAHRPRHAARIDERRLEIAILPVVGEILEMGVPGRIVVVGAAEFGAALAYRDRRRHAEDLREALRQEGEPQVGVHFPPPVGGDASQERELVGGGRHFQLTSSSASRIIRASSRLRNGLLSSRTPGSSRPLRAIASSV